MAVKSADQIDYLRIASGFFFGGNGSVGVEVRTWL